MSTGGSISVSVKASFIERLRFWAQPVVVLVSFAVGLSLFGTAPATVAAVAVGVALSQLIRGK